MLDKARNGLSGVVVIAIAAGLFSVSCNEPTAPADREPTQDELANAVAGEAAGTVNSEGKFNLSVPVAEGPYEEVSGGQANALAVSFAKEFGPLIMTTLQEDHGGPIQFQQLAVCGRTFYAKSPYEPPPSYFHAPARRLHGPKWLVTLCVGSKPTLSVAVSAWTADLSIVAGKVRFPFVSGGEFFMLGIPQGHVGEFPISPERAATTASAKTGRRVVSAPELVLPLRQHAPQHARWRFRAETVAALKTSGGPLVTNDLFTGHSGLTMHYAPAPAQPATLDYIFSPAPEPGESYEVFVARQAQETRTVSMPRKPSMPVVFYTIEGGASQ